MTFSGLFASVAAMPMELQIGALIIGLAIAIVFHEVAHGYVALKLGDPTAKYAGRLTLNPIAHIDMVGTIIVPLFLIIASIAANGLMPIFGWAKPVPVNYYNLRHGKWGPVWVALAGPATNLILMIIFGVLSFLAPAGTALPQLLYTIVFINGILMLFNLIPVPPLDGSKILYVFLEKRQDIIMFLERYGFFILLALIFFGRDWLGVFVFQPALFLTNFFTGTFF